MTTEPAFAAGEAGEMLSRSRELAHRVRAAQRGTWFPLLVLAAVTFIAIPVDRFGHFATTCRAVPGAGPGGEICRRYSTAGLLYWPIALALAYVAIAAFYVRAARSRGVGTRVRPYIAVGIVIALLVTAASVWAAHHPPVGEHEVLGLHLQAEPSGFFFKLTGPACAIGLALLVLARAERSVALALFTLGYLAIVLVPINFDRAVSHPSPWFFAPHLVIDGTVLLLGAIGFALARPRGRRSGRPAPPAA
jgi:hypothetical protein